MDTPTLPGTACPHAVQTITRNTAMTNTLRTKTRSLLPIGFTVLIERLAQLLGRPTRLA